MILALALALAGADPIAAAARGLAAEIEDDNGPDFAMESIAGRGCTVTIAGHGHRWTIDMTNARAVTLGDTFVYVAAPPVALAIVGDASKPDQAAKLKGLATALTDLAARCRPIG